MIEYLKNILHVLHFWIVFTILYLLIRVVQYCKPEYYNKNVKQFVNDVFLKVPAESFLTSDNEHSQSYSYKDYLSLAYNLFNGKYMNKTEQSGGGSEGSEGGSPEGGGGGGGSESGNPDESEGGGSPEGGGGGGGSNDIDFLYNLDKLLNSYLLEAPEENLDPLKSIPIPRLLMANSVPTNIGEISLFLLLKNFGFDNNLYTTKNKLVSYSEYIVYVAYKVIAFIIIIALAIMATVYKLLRIKKISILETSANFILSIIGIAILFFVFGFIADMITPALNMMLNFPKDYKLLKFKKNAETDMDYESYLKNAVEFNLTPSYKGDGNDYNTIKDAIAMSLHEQYQSEMDAGIKWDYFKRLLRTSPENVYFDLDKDIYSVSDDNKGNVINSIKSSLSNKEPFYLTQIKELFTNGLTDNKIYNLKKENIFGYLLSCIFSKQGNIYNIISIVIVYLLANTSIKSSYYLIEKSNKLLKNTRVIRLVIFVIIVLVLGWIFTVLHLLLIYVLKFIGAFVLYKLNLEFFNTMLEDETSGLFLASYVPVKIAKYIHNKDFANLYSLLKSKEFWFDFKSLFYIFLIIIVVILFLLINNIEEYPLIKENDERKLFREKYINIACSIMFLGLFSILFYFMFR